jgi:hypothetical protein
MAHPNSLPTVNIRTNERAFLAGYFEGEGSVFCGGQQHQLLVAVGSGDKPILDRFAAAFGGNVLTKKGKLTNRQQWVWKRSGLHAQVFLKAILPWLVTKKPVALMGLFLNYQMRGGRVTRISAEELERRAWASRCMSAYNNRNTLLV